MGVLMLFREMDKNSLKINRISSFDLIELLHITFNYFFSFLLLHAQKKLCLCSLGALNLSFFFSTACVIS